MTEESLFAAAIALADPIARAAFLDRACHGDAELRRAVEALLVAHHQDNPLDRPFCVDPNVTQSYAPSTEKPGAVVAENHEIEALDRGIAQKSAARLVDGHVAQPVPLEVRLEGDLVMVVAVHATIPA